jgi:hypothetical protein
MLHCFYCDQFIVFFGYPNFFAQSLAHSLYQSSRYWDDHRFPDTPSNCTLSSSVHCISVSTLVTTYCTIVLIYGHVPYILLFVNSFFINLYQTFYSILFNMIELISWYYKIIIFSVYEPSLFFIFKINT